MSFPLLPSPPGGAYLEIPSTLAIHGKGDQHNEGHDGKTAHT